MSGTAADLFFWNDHQGDPCLRLCSLAAQGLWMRLLCLAGESTKKGFVLINGKKPSIGQIAKIAGCSPADLLKLSQELEANEVFSRDAEGVIYCRRMVRAEKKRRICSKGGRKGGASTYSKQKGIFTSQEVTQGASQGVTQAPIPLPVPNPLPKPEKKPSLRSDDAAPIPDWVPPEAWNGFDDMRRSKAQAPGKARVPWTAGAMAAAITKLTKLRDQGQDPVGVLEQSTLEGWSGLFPVKEDRTTVGRPPLFAPDVPRTILNVVDGGKA